MCTHTATHRAAVSRFDFTPYELNEYPKDDCQWHEYVAWLTGEGVDYCNATVRLCGNVSVRLGEGDQWRDFSLCEFHADKVDKVFGVAPVEVEEGDDDGR